MSNIFTSAIYSAKTQLNEAGIEVKSSHLHQIASASVGFHNCQEMQDANIIQLLQDDSSIVVLQPYFAEKRAKNLLSELSVKERRQIVQTVIDQIRPVLPPSTYSSDSDFVHKYVAPLVEHYLLSNEDEAIAEAQAKVGARCNTVAYEDSNGEDLLYVHGETWDVPVEAMMYPSYPDGKPRYFEDQISTTTNMTFSKRSRAILSPNPSPSATAHAFKYDSGRGGIPL